MKIRLCNLIVLFFDLYPTGTVDQVRGFALDRNKRISPTHQEVNNHMKILCIKFSRVPHLKYKFNHNHVGLWKIKPNAMDLIEKYT